jgi:hypothetical protein
MPLLASEDEFAGEEIVARRSAALLVGFLGRFAGSANSRSRPHASGLTRFILFGNIQGGKMSAELDLVAKRAVTWS